MSSKYKVGEDAIPHFVTFSIVGWVDVFSRESYKEIFVNKEAGWFGSPGIINIAVPLIIILMSMGC